MPSTPGRRCPTPGKQGCGLCAPKVGSEITVTRVHGWRGEKGRNPKPGSVPSGPTKWRPHSTVLKERVHKGPGTRGGEGGFLLAGPLASWGETRESTLGDHAALRPCVGGAPVCRVRETLVGVAGEDAFSADDPVGLPHGAPGESPRGLAGELGEASGPLARTPGPSDF